MEGIELKSVKAITVPVAGEKSEGGNSGAVGEPNVKYARACSVPVAGDKDTGAVEQPTGVERKCERASSVPIDGDRPERGTEQLKQVRKTILDRLLGVQRRRIDIGNRRGKARMFCITCNFGTDDFFFLSLIVLLLRVAWLVYGSVTCAYIFLLYTNCPTSVYVPLSLQISLPGLLGFFLLTSLCYILTAIVSSRGTLIRHKPREKVVHLAYVLVLLAVLEFCWYVFSTYAVVVAGVDVAAPSSLVLGSGGGSGGGGEEEEEGSESASGMFVLEDGTENAAFCSNYKTWVIHFGVVVGLAWICYAFIFVIFLFGMDPCGLFLPTRAIHKLVRAQERAKDEYLVGAEKPLNDYDQHDNNRNNRNRVSGHLLRSRVKQSCCFCVRRDGLDTSAVDAFSNVVNVLRLLFDDIDATYSDLVAGFMLANLYQRKLKAANKNLDTELNRATLKLLKENKFVSTQYKSPHPKILKDAEAEKLAEDFRYYFKFAAASYGCPIQIYLHPCTGPCSLFVSAKGCCCGCTICQLQQYDGDTCYPNPAAIKAIAGVEPEDIVAASFIDSVSKVPYYAVYQPVEKRMVIAIRGTLSLEDALTDVSVLMCKIPGGLLNVDNVYIHKGFYDSAMYVYKSLMGEAEQWPLFTGPLKTNDVKEIVITGHSLGAAVAAVLAVLFKHYHQDDPWIGCLRAITFSTPAACMSYNLAEKTKSFITTVVGGNDLVSRMTIRSLGYLKLLIQSILVSVDSPKHQVLCCSGRSRTQCCPPRVQEEENFVGLAYTKEELQAVEVLNIEAKLNETPSYKKLRVYRPARSIASKMNKVKKEGRDAVSKLHEKMEECGGGAVEREDQPMMFLPGRIVHLEETQQYARSKCGLRKHRRVRGTWKAREKLSAIRVDKDMLLDHTPHRVNSLLERFQKYPDSSPVPVPKASDDEIDFENVRRFSA